MSCQVIIHVSCHIIIVATSTKGWSRFDEIFEQSWFVGEYRRWLMFKHQRDSWTTFFLRRKMTNDRWSVIGHQGDRWEGLVHKVNHQSSITDRNNINSPKWFRFRLTVQITLKKNCSTVSKKLSLETFSYFGHNWRKLSHIEMKIMVFFQRNYIYKSVRENHCPFLFGFVKKIQNIGF